MTKFLCEVIDRKTKKQLLPMKEIEASSDYLARELMYWEVCNQIQYRPYVRAKLEDVDWTIDSIEI